jgi:CAAX protease family protein
MTRWRFAAPWYAILIVPPILVLAVLVCLRTLVSPVYTPKRFLLGVFFGVPAGLLEETGWMGFAFLKLTLRNNGFLSAIFLGLLWSLWHLPVINFLGTVTPHRSCWLPFFLAFALAMTAMRVLISWAYLNTHSLLLAQLLHISSTASLVVFSPAAVSGSQEVSWYAIYGGVLWALVLIIRAAFGPSLVGYANVTSFFGSGS